MRQYNLRKPLLNDARTLRDPQYSQFPDTIEANRKLLRALADDRAQELLVFETFEQMEDTTERTALAFLRILRASEGGRYEVHCYPAHNFANEPGVVQAFKQEFSAWLEDHHEILQLGFLLPLSGIQEQANTSNEIGHSSEKSVDVLANILDELGFVAETMPVKESELLHAASNPASGSTDESSEGAFVYRRWFWDRGVHGYYSLAFVPCNTGVTLIMLDPERVRSVSFLNYEEKPEDPWVMNEAWRAGLTDRKGTVLKKEEIRLDPFTEAEYLAGLNDLARDAVRQIQAYYNHERQTFTIPFSTDQGTRFQRLVWRVLQNIPYGSTRTYEEVGQAVFAEASRDKEIALNRDEMQLRGKDLARAVGGACKANPLQILIPCHRVIGKDGNILGYTGDSSIKSWLLWEEQVGLSSEALR